jgi:hypothetical protein
MKLKDSFAGCREEDVMKMTKEELQQAVLRVFSLECFTFAENDSWRGEFLLPDDVADAFRGNN